MYNIINHLKEALESLERQGFTYEIPRKLLIAEIKRTTSVFNEKTLANWTRSFVEMGYIRVKSPVVFERCVTFDKSYVFMTGKDYNGTIEGMTDGQQLKK